MQDHERGLWNIGEIVLGVHGNGLEADRIVVVPRPFALIGRGCDCDIEIDDRAVNDRHVYFHLERRGLFAVDLATRAGTRLPGNGETATWLATGDRIEVASRSIEVLQLQVDGHTIDSPTADGDLLSGIDDDNLAPLVLEPRHGRGESWTLGSALVFAGRSASCGIVLDDPLAAKIHGVFVRTPSITYFVSVCGRDCWLDGALLRGATALRAGQSLTLGATVFVARTATAIEQAPVVVEPSPPPALLAQVIDPEIEDENEPRTAGALATIPAGTQRALLAWMMETIRDNHTAALRQQTEMQTALVQLLQEVHHDHSALLGAHLTRIENIDRELSALRAELVQRGVSPETPSPAHSLPAPPEVAPLRVTRKTAQDTGKASTAWLLERVSRLEDENRSAWKELLGRAQIQPATSIEKRARRRAEPLRAVAISGTYFAPRGVGNPLCD